MQCQSQQVRLVESETFHSCTKCNLFTLPGLYGRTCTCPPGYHGNGIGQAGCIQGAAASPCTPNPCVHGRCVVSMTMSTYDCLYTIPKISKGHGTSCMSDYGILI